MDNYQILSFCLYTLNLNDNPSKTVLQFFCGPRPFFNSVERRRLKASMSPSSHRFTDPAAHWPLATSCRQPCNLENQPFEANSKSILFRTLPYFSILFHTLPSCSKRITKGICFSTLEQEVQETAAPGGKLMSEFPPTLVIPKGSKKPSGACCMSLQSFAWIFEPSTCCKIWENKCLKNNQIKYYKIIHAFHLIIH